MQQHWLKSESNGTINRTTELVLSCVVELRQTKKSKIFGCKKQVSDDILRKKNGAVLERLKFPFCMFRVYATFIVERICVIHSCCYKTTNLLPRKIRFRLQVLEISLRL